MEEEYKYMAEVLLNLPKDKTIYIGGHIETPDADSIGSSLALAKYLNSLGYTAYALLDEKDNDFMEWFDGDKSEIVNFVESKSGHTFIMLDCNNITRLDKFQSIFESADITVNIDHHEDNKGEAKYTISNGEISSTCEMLYDIFVHIDPNLISLEISTLLYAGAMTDTCCFQRRLTSRTLLIAQVLINKGVNYKHLIRNLFTKRSMLEVDAYSKLAKSIQSYGNFDYVIADKRTDDYRNVSQYLFTKKISEELRKIDTLGTFLLLMVYDDRIVGKTMCNDGDIAVRLASYFGGGGHKTEGGFTIKNMTPEEILGATKKFIENDGV